MASKIKRKQNLNVAMTLISKELYENEAFMNIMMQLYILNILKLYIKVTTYIILPV
jgi:hypothetical protein